MEPCAGRIPIRRGSTGSPPEKVRVKIPVMAQAIPLITNAAVVISAGFEMRARSMKTAATAKSRIAAVEYLFRLIRVIFFHGSSTGIPDSRVVQYRIAGTCTYAISDWNLMNFISFIRDICAVSRIFFGGKKISACNNVQDSFDDNNPEQDNSCCYEVFDIPQVARLDIPWLDDLHNHQEPYKAEDKKDLKVYPPCEDEDR
jgi:hypothetical protein